MHHLLGTVIDGRFQVLAILGQGGMGAVFEARQVALERRCALKVMLPGLLEVPMAKQRFVREAQLAARIKHPNVVEVFDTGTTQDGLSYIAMEYLEGEGLDRTLERERRLPWRRARHIVLQICRALEAAHASRIVHRDLKPANCVRITLAGDSDYVKIVDFGIAKALQGADQQTKLTLGDGPLGTVDYMAYEQALGLEDCDHRVDIWAVGVILFELLTGNLPFRGANSSSPMQRLAAIIHRDPTPLREAIPASAIPEGTEEVILQALTKDRNHRFQTITELAEALESLPADVSNDSFVPPEVELPPHDGPTEIHPDAVVSEEDSRSSMSRAEAPSSAPSEPSRGSSDPADPGADKPSARVRRFAGVITLALGVVAVVALILAMRPRSGPVIEPEVETTTMLAGASTGSTGDAHASTAAPSRTNTTGDDSTTTDAGNASSQHNTSGDEDSTTGPPPPPSKVATKLTDSQACDALKRMTKALMKKCLGKLDIEFRLSIKTKAGRVRLVDLENKIYATNPKYECLKEGLEAKSPRIEGLTGTRSFRCPVVGARL